MLLVSSEIFDSRHVRMHRVMFFLPNTLRKLMIRVWCLSVSGYVIDV